MLTTFDEHAILHLRMTYYFRFTCLCILLVLLMPLSGRAAGEFRGIQSPNTTPSADIWRFSSDSHWMGLDYGSFLMSERAALESQLIDDKISFLAEFCRSQWSDSPTDDNTAVPNHAWITRLRGKDGMISWGVSTSFMSPAYMTQSNPLIGDNRSRYSFDSTIDLKPSTFSLSMLRSRDYLDNEATNPLAWTNAGTLQYTYACTDRPTFLTSYTVHDFAYAHGDGNDQRVRNVSRTITIGTSLAGPCWSVSPSYSLKRLDDKTTYREDDLDSTVVKVTGFFAPDERVSIVPLVSVTSTVPAYAGVRTNTYRSSLSTTVALIPRNLSLTTTFAHLDSRAQDKSVDTTSLSAGGRIDWSLDRFIPAPINKSVSIGAHAVRTRDHAGAATKNTWDMSATVMIGSPNRSGIASREQVVACH